MVEGAADGRPTVGHVPYRLRTEQPLRIRLRVHQDLEDLGGRGRQMALDGGHGCTYPTPRCPNPLLVEASTGIVEPSER